jgi:hypothetical protein
MQADNKRTWLATAFFWDGTRPRFSEFYCQILLTDWRISMVPAISANSLLVWFVWGMFMALGWVLGTFVMEWLLGFLGKRRNRLYDFLGSLRDSH